MKKEQHTSPTVGLSDEAIIEGLRNRDPQITRDYFYGVCRIDAIVCFSNTTNYGAGMHGGGAARTARSFNIIPYEKVPFYFSIMFTFPTADSSDHCKI